MEPMLAADFAQHLIDARNTTNFTIDCRFDSLERQLAAASIERASWPVFIGVESE
jgi:hypothetical protein